MKKNIMSVIIIALVTLNIVLTGVIMFVMVPSLNKVNTLIAKVSTAVDLDLGYLEVPNKNELTIAQKTNYTLEKEFSGTLKASSDGKLHYVAIDSISFTLNNQSPSFEEVNANIANYQTNINDLVSQIFNEYTIADVVNKQEEIKEKVLERTKDLFGGADCFVSVAFSNLRFQ